MLLKACFVARVCRKPHMMVVLAHICYNLSSSFGTCGCRIVANMPAFQAGDESSILSTRTKISPQALVAQLDRAGDF